MHFLTIKFHADQETLNNWRNTCVGLDIFFGNIIKVDRKLEVILFIIILPSKKTVIFGILNFRHHIFGPSFGLGLRAFWGSRALAESRKPEDFHHVQSMVKTMILGDFPLEHHWKIYGKSHGKTEHHWKIIVKTHGKSHGILLIDFHWKTIGTSDSLILYIYIYIGTSDQHIHIYIYIYLYLDFQQNHWNKTHGILVVDSLSRLRFWIQRGSPQWFERRQRQRGHREMFCVFSSFFFGISRESVSRESVFLIPIYCYYYCYCYYYGIIVLFYYCHYLYLSSG